VPAVCQPRRLNNQASILWQRLHTAGKRTHAADQTERPSPLFEDPPSPTAAVVAAAIGKSQSK
jgi:hypothetical protein